MDSFSPKQLILNYVEGWIAGNREQILSTLDPACVGEQWLRVNLTVQIPLLLQW